MVAIYNKVVVDSVCALVSPSVLSVLHSWGRHCVGVPGAHAGGSYSKNSIFSPGAGDIMKKVMWTFDVNYLEQ